MEQEPFIKIIVVGEQGVGKTCMLKQYCYDNFDIVSPPTIGCDFTTKITTFKEKTVRLQLWDIAGQERYNSISRLYVRGALGCIIVCDIKDEKSLLETIKWKKIVDENCDRADDKPFPIILVQNKVDEVKNVGQLEPYQKKQFLEDFGRKNQFSAVFQTSAKQNINLKELFNKLLELILTSGRLDVKKNDDNFGNGKKQEKKIVLNSQTASQPKSESQKKDGGCC